MDLRNKKSTKIIKTIFIIITTVILIELVIAGTLFLTEKRKEKKIEEINDINKNEPIKLITEIEKEAILEKEPPQIKQEEENQEIDTNPRTRPLPKISF